MEEIQNSTEALANLCLAGAEKYHSYTDRDLVNASLIFSHFLMDAIYTSNRSLDLDKQMESAKITGEALRELIKACSGKDMHQLVKQL